MICQNKNKLRFMNYRLSYTLLFVLQLSSGLIYLLLSQHKPTANDICDKIALAVLLFDILNSPAGRKT